MVQAPAAGSSHLLHCNVVILRCDYCSLADADLSALISKEKKKRKDKHIFEELLAQREVRVVWHSRTSHSPSSRLTCGSNSSLLLLCFQAWHDFDVIFPALGWSITAILRWYGPLWYFYVDIQQLVSKIWLVYLEPTSFSHFQIWTTEI